MVRAEYLHLTGSFMKDQVFASMSDMNFESCEFCGEDFPNLAARRSYHKRAMKDCEKMYIWQSQFSRRLNKRSHPNGKKIRGGKTTEEEKKTEKLADMLPGKPKNCCGQCGKIFSNESKLNFHKERNHGEFSCSNCSLGFSSEGLLADHSKRHKTYPCHECKTNFRKKSLLKIHMETHQMTFHICNECGNKFSIYANLKRHTRNIHGVGKGQEEKKLEGKFETDNDNNEGLSKETKDCSKIQTEKSEICGECGNTFASKNSLKRHTRNIHDGIKAENLLNKGKYESDMTKEGEDPVAKELLKDPLASHQKKLHICTECDNRFSSKDNLKRHMRNIHGGGKKSEGKPAKGKREPDNDNNTDVVKETKPFNDEIKSLSTLASEEPMDIIEELEEFPLLEPDDMEEIFSEFGLTTSEMIDLFKY